MKSPHRGLTARRRFWVVVFALVSLGIMAGGLKYYRYEQDHIRREKYQDLAAIADLKVRQILEWRRERLDDARSLARDPFLGKAIAEWLRDPGNLGLRAALLKRLKVEKEGGAYGNVLLADPDGRILLSVRPDPAPLSPAGKQAIEGAVVGRQAVLGDLFRCPKDHRVHLDLAAPVQDHQGQPLAVVVLKTNADEVLYPLIQSWPTPSLTAETLLVEVEGKDVLFLNELRHREKTALSLREPLTRKDLPAVQAGLGKQGVFEGRDYRGKKVLADLRPVPQSPWFMVAKVDADEILAEARYRAGITALFVVIFILLTAAVTAHGYRQRQANLYQDLYHSEQKQRQAQEEFRTTLYSIGDAVITTDTEGLVKHINPVAEQLTGWLEAEARGKPIEEVFRIINEETRTAVENPAQRVLREGVVVGLANHTLLVARDGAERPIADSGAPIRDENGAVIGVVLVFRDQTEERAAQNALRQSEEKYRLLVNQIPAVVFQGYGDWSVDFFDNKIEILSGYTKEEFDSRKIKWCDLILPEDLNNLHGIFIEALKTDKSYAREYRIRKKDGSISWIQAMGRIFCDDTGKVDHVNGVFFDITERKRAEEALRASEEKYRLVGDYNYNWEYWISPSGAMIYNSPSCRRITGYSPEEFIADYRLIEAIVHPEDQDKMVAHNQKIMQESYELCDLEFRIITKGGEDRWLRHVCQPVYGDQNIWMGRRASNRDITDRKRAEEKVRLNEARLQTLLNISQHDAQNVQDLLDYTLNAAIQLTGSKVGYIYHYDEESQIFILNTWSKDIMRECLVVEPQTVYQLENTGIWGEAVRQRQPITVNDFKAPNPLKKGYPEGHVELSRYLTIPVFDGKKIVAVVGVANKERDYDETDVLQLSLLIDGVWKISARKQAEEAFQVLVNRAPMGIFIVQDGKCQMVNPGFEQITGYPAQELLGHDSRTLVHPDYREMARETAIRMLKGKLDLAYEFPIITKSGETRWVIEKVTSTIYRGKRAVLGYFLDISERKSLEAQFLQAQKMEAVGTLAGGIAHDFNNILTAILGNIGLAVLDDKIGPRVQDRLAQAEAACLRAQALSQQLLTFAKGGAPVTKLFSVVELLTESTAFTCVGSPVKCETSFPENLWWLEADPGQIGQVFQNLTINAIQAMPTGGTIKVWAENLTLGTKSDLPLSAGRYIKISVRDQGMGIPAEHLTRIFDPYFTTKHKGSGLGLASAYAIIKKHHGHIAVESKQGVGTTFYIYLPAIERQVAPQPEEDRELLVGKGKILVMDDEEMVREVLGRILPRLGYEAEFAGDGGEAIEIFVQAHGSGQAFAAVILDLTVPGAMGGKETMARLLEIDPQVKAIVSSGYSDNPIMADFQKYGFSGVIAKPYKISELGKILQEVVMGKL